MKKLFTILTIALGTVAMAQTNTEDVDLIQSIYGKEKKAITADFITLDPSKADAFWGLYDAYEVERKQLGKRRIANLERYAANYGKADDATVNSIVKESMTVGLALDKLIQKYHAKIQKEVGAVPAAQFYQLEAYFLSAVRVELLGNIPFIGELSK